MSLSANSDWTECDAAAFQVKAEGEPSPYQSRGRFRHHKVADGERKIPRQMYAVVFVIVMTEPERSEAMMWFLKTEIK